MSARSSSITSREVAGSWSEASPARPGPLQQPAGRVMIGHDGMDPVAQQGPQPRQLDPVAQQRPQLADSGQGDPRLRQQVHAQQLRQDRRTGPRHSSAWPRRSPCTAADAPDVG